VKFYIGTSGWHYKHWMGVFYPAGTATSEMLEFYARHFGTVEINNSFYRLPTATTFDNWRERSPRSFCFAVKASRFITHIKKLKDPKSSSAKFFEVADRLGKKLGPILFQLPPRWKVNVERLSEFLEALPQRHKYVFEFRDESWLTEEVFAVLRQHGAAHCIHDFEEMKIPHEITAEFSYVRFHGPTSAKYAGSYSKRELRTWIEEMRKWEVREVYVYFNNDPGGAAVRNATTLREMLGA
jgi:uncharacterized protein YecE (DUF72 family)